ncbi:S-adenosylmethionine-dependent methyltransferase, putative [Plasmodium sp. DRC-Itaito]|nr:S-adenosylmethionine-dependent methyltransferase, putative [Plasmodium sp. DRC-Itaito]
MGYFLQFPKEGFYFFSYFKKSCNNNKYILLCKKRSITCLCRRKYYHSNIDCVIDNPKKRPTLILNEKSVKSVINGFPWLYSKDIKNAEELYIYSPCLVNIKDEYNENIGVGIYNKNSIISSRLLSRNINEHINEEFFNIRIRKAYEKRLELFHNENFFRVVNAESDFLPGIIIDKYNKLVCVQINASGMDILLPIIMKSIENVLNPDIIIIKNDNKIRKLEKLPIKKEIYKGIYKSPIEVQENGITFFVDILNGQKTGWYYDQRYNRTMLIPYCKDKNVLDLFSYVGSFGITLAYYGAKEVTCVDSSYSAIKNGIHAAQYNNILDKINFVHGCVRNFLHVCLNIQILLQDNKRTNMINVFDHKLSICENSLDLKEEKNNLLLQNNQNKLYNENMLINSNVPMQLQQNDTHISFDNNTKKKNTNNNLLPNINQNNNNFDYVNNEKLLTDMKNLSIYEKKKTDTYIEDIEFLLSNNYKFFQKTYDVILIDPPPLARNNYCLPSALKIYEKLLYVSFRIIQKPGYVFVSSCNKLIGYDNLLLCIKRALKWSKCEGTIIGEGRISSDHPIHISLPETKYLTSILLMIT